MAEYQGKNVTLNNPRRISKGETSYGRKKSVVYVRDGDGVKRVTFGDPNMRIKKNQKGRRSNFRSRHNCDNPGPKRKRIKEGSGEKMRKKGAKGAPTKGTFKAIAKKQKQKKKKGKKNGK